MQSASAPIPPLNAVCPTYLPKTSITSIRLCLISVVFISTEVVKTSIPDWNNHRLYSLRICLPRDPLDYSIKSTAISTAREHTDPFYGSHYALLTYKKHIVYFHLSNIGHQVLLRQERLICLLSSNLFITIYSQLFEL